MNIDRLSFPFVRSVLCRISFAVIISAACVSAEANPSGNDAVFSLKSKYPNIQVHHTPLPAHDNARRVLPKGTLRTQLPVVTVKTPKAGKLIRTDNTYLVHCPPPLLRSSTNAPAALIPKDR